MSVVETNAQPMSQEDYESWVIQAHQDEAEIKAGLKDVRGGLWRTAKALYSFTENTGWTALGYESLGEWLADPDVTLTRSTYYRMLQAWTELHVLRKVPEDKLAALDLTKAHIALPALKRGDAPVDVIVADVEALGARDLREKYRGEGETIAVASDEDGEPDVGGPEVPEWAGPQLDDEDPGTPPPNANVGTVYVERGIAETLTLVLEAVAEALGPPESKKVAKGIRGQIFAALELAHAEGLGRV